MNEMENDMTNLLGTRHTSGRAPILLALAVLVVAGSLATPAWGQDVDPHTDSGIDGVAPEDRGDDNAHASGGGNSLGAGGDADARADKHSVNTTRDVYDRSANRRADRIGMEKAMGKLIGVEIAWFVAIALIALVAALRRAENCREVRALNMPRGSIRAILALAIIGSFLIFLTFTPFLCCTDNGDTIDKVLIAYGTLSGAVTGFYFGGRAASSPPKGNSTTG